MDPATQLMAALAGLQGWQFSCGALCELLAELTATRKWLLCPCNSLHCGHTVYAGWPARGDVCGTSCWEGKLFWCRRRSSDEPVSPHEWVGRGHWRAIPGADPSMVWLVITSHYRQRLLKVQVHIGDLPESFPRNTVYVTTTGNGVCGALLQRSGDARLTARHSAAVMVAIGGGEEQGVNYDPGTEWRSDLGRLVWQTPDPGASSSGYQLDPLTGLRFGLDDRRSRTNGFTWTVLQGLHGDPAHAGQTADGLYQPFTQWQGTRCVDSATPSSLRTSPTQSRTFCVEQTAVRVICPREHGDFIRPHWNRWHGCNTCIACLMPAAYLNSYSWGTCACRLTMGQTSALDFDGMWIPSTQPCTAGVSVHPTEVFTPDPAREYWNSPWYTTVGRGF